MSEKPNNMGSKIFVVLCVTMILGGVFLDYGVLAHDPEHGQHYGILLVELGVMITVFGVMVTVFYFFSARGREDL